jgi:hypothetical protein
MKVAEILVEPVVAVIAPKLREAVGDGGLFLGDEVAPELAVRQRLRRRDRAVGIDVIAGMDEEVRPVLEHGPVAAIAAAGDIDAPALARNISGPDKGD